MKRTYKNIDLGIFIIRLSVGFLMLLHGITKLIHGIDGIKNILSDIGLPEFIAYGVLIGEIVAPVAIIIGLKTRIFAAVFFVNCLFALALGHRQTLLSLSPAGGWSAELIALYLFGSLTLLFTGGGKYSITRKGVLD